MNDLSIELRVNLIKIGETKAALTRRVLKQLPKRWIYNSQQFKRSVCWVWEDAVFSRRDAYHRPIVLCEFEFDGRAQFAWVQPNDSPCLQFRWKNDELIDTWAIDATPIPHAIVP